MNPKELIARRVAREIQPGMLVNLGIGLPSLIANYVPAGKGVSFQSENGIIGMSGRPPEGMENIHLSDAGGGFITAVPGAASLDTSMSFGLIRGGHLDVTVLGGLQVDVKGQLANWKVPGKLVPGMGGAMDLVTGAKRVIVAMQHTTKNGPKIVEKCTMPLTSVRRIDLIITELAVIEPRDEGLVLLEHAPGVTVEDIVAATGVKLIMSDKIAEMNLDCD